MRERGRAAEAIALDISPWPRLTAYSKTAFLGSSSRGGRDRRTPASARGSSEGIRRYSAADEGLAAADFAGWVSILTLATTIPRLIFEIALSSLGGEAMIVHAGLKVLDTFLGIYLFVSLRRLLSGGFWSYEDDAAITWWIAFGAFFSAVNVILGWSGKPIGLAALGVGIAAGILLDIILGVMLLRLRDDPHGYLKAYAFSHIASGVCVIVGVML